jgi:ABC-type sugar transport system permease subunit
VRHKWWQSFLFILPTFVVLLFVFGYPIVRIFDFSFRQVWGTSGAFTGLRNYRFVLRDPIFVGAAQHNGILLLGVPVLVLVALVIAAILYEEPRGWRLYRFSIFVPYVLAIPVIGVIFSYLMTLNGVFNQILRGVGLGALALDWIGSPRYALFTTLAVIIWKEAGFGIVLFLARLMSVSQELYDSAHIDGTSWWQTFWYITVPQLRMVIEFFIIVSIINFLAWVFGYVFVLTAGGPANSTQVLELWIFNKVSRVTQNPGMAAAGSVLLLLVSSVFIFVLLNLRIRVGEET